MDECRNEAGLRANDPAELPDTDCEEADTDTKATPTPPASAIDEASAESAPELRDIAMPHGVDHADGRRSNS